jgi:hypothetical protein
VTAVNGYQCTDGDRRLLDTRAAGRLNGLDWVEVDDGRSGVRARRTLLVRCLLPLPADLAGSDLRIEGGVRVDPALNPVQVDWAVPASRLGAARKAGLVSVEDADAFGGLPDPDRLLVVRTNSPGDFSSYRLVVVEPDRWGFDPRLAGIDFMFNVDCLTDLDCPVPAACPPERVAEPVVDYLGRDFTGLRQVLLDRLSLLVPRWTDRSVADLGVTLVELFAYLGDNLSYAQDSVSAEAYLGTARRRVSVARHARLLDYRMHQGAAARTWLAVSADALADGVKLPAGTEVSAADGAVFHTLHELTVRSARSAIDFYAWGDLYCCLPSGATRATLRGTCAELGLHAGDVLLMEEVRGPSGKEMDADRTHRWAVRLSEEPVDAIDPVTETEVSEVAWRAEDALPFPLCVWQFPRGRCLDHLGASVVRGNVVLVEHGKLVPLEPVVPDRVPPRGRYRPTLERLGLAYAMPYRHAEAVQRPAAEALEVRPDEAVPQIVRLTDGREDWTVRPDLLGSDRFEPAFVVEMDDGGLARLRFGDPPSRAPVPGATVRASYRVGGGLGGNVGADVLTDLAPPVAGLSVRNPIPARGGVDPEPVEQVRQWAPQAFRVQERAVTDGDYREVTERHPQVQRAAATRRWTGSWYTEYVTIDRLRGAAVDRPFRTEVAAYLESFRMAGVDVAVDAPIPVPLDIVLTICVEPGNLRSAVQRALTDRFSARDLPGGGRGFFHQDNFTFAQPVYLSAVVAAAMAVEGVRWVETVEGPGKPNRFRRWGRPSAGERDAGRITMQRLEVARCDSDPDQPENGRIAFAMVGGL